MNRGIISTRYAKALFSFALERGKEDEVYSKMKQLSKSFFEVPGFEHSLSKPVLSAKDKVSLVGTASGEIESREFDQFVSLVIKNRREYLLRNISLVYVNLHLKHKKISICSLVTAVPVTDEIERKIKKLITGKTHGSVELNKSVNPSILGGFVFELDFNRLDASVATQLSRIKKRLEAINN